MATLVASLNTAIGRLGTFRTDASEAATAARSLGTASRSTEGEVAEMGKGAASGGGLFGKLKSGLTGAKAGMEGLNGAMKANLIGLLLTLLQPLIQKFLDMIMHSKAVQAAIQEAFKIIGEVVGTVSKYVQGVINEVWPWISATVKTVVTVISTLVKTYFEIIRAEIELVMTVVKTVISVTWDAIHTVFTVTLDAIKAVVSGAWNGIKAVIMPVVDWISSAIPNAWHTVSDALSSAWSGMANIAKGAFDAVLSAVKGPIDAIIGLVNSAIDGLNSVHVSIPSWVPVIGGKSFGVSLPHIPMLADGGIVLPRAGGTLAVLGEGGQSEAVVPLSKLSQLLPSPGAAGPAGAGASGMVIQNYYEAEHGSARRTAEQLMFLAKARG